MLSRHFAYNGVQCGLVFFARVPVRCPRLSPFLRPLSILFHRNDGLACQWSAFQFCPVGNLHSRGDERRVVPFALHSRHGIASDAGFDFVAPCQSVSSGRPSGAKLERLPGNADILNPS